MDSVGGGQMRYLVKYEWGIDARVHIKGEIKVKMDSVGKGR